MGADQYRCSTIVIKRLNVYIPILVIILALSIALNLFLFKKLEDAAFEGSAKYFYRTVKILEQLNNVQIDETTGNVLPTSRVVSK